MEHVLGDADAIGGERDLVGGAADADGDAILLTGAALEVADEEGEQIGGHLGSGVELQGVLCVSRAGGVGGDGAVGDGGVALVDDQGHVEGGLEGGLVKAGEGTAGVGGLELGDGVVAMRGFGEIEAAQFIVEDAGELDVDGGFAGGQRLGDREGGLLLVVVEGDGCGLLLIPGLDLDRLEGDLDGVEGDGRAGLLQVYFDGLGTGDVAALRSGVSVSV